MKRAVARFGAVLLVALCLLAASSKAVHEVVPGSGSAEAPSVSISRAKPIGYVAYPETSEHFLFDFPTSGDRGNYERQVALLLATGELLRAKAARYFCSDARRLQCRKADGLFPFHSFW